MRPRPTPPITLPIDRLLKLALAAVQVFDIGLHVATNQAEPLRIAGNLFILAWLAAPSSGRWLTFARPLAVGCLAVYLALNLLFLAQAGLTNPAADDAPRLALFGLLLITVLLSASLIYRRSQAKSN